MRLLNLLLFLSCTSVLAVESAPQRSCSSTKEYITALEYLRGNPKFKIPEAQARRLAQRVTEGCTGAAERFIRVTQALSMAKLGTNNAIETGLEFTKRTDRESETFLIVFKYAYLGEYLDLDLRTSLQMARSLSTEFEGDTLAVRDDFRTLAEYCVGEKGLGLPRPHCASFAVRMSKRGQSFSGGIAQPFIQLYEFLGSSESGPSLPTLQALRLSEELIGSGPDSTRNFIHAYRYALSKDGLQLPDRDALKFAREMALGSSIVHEVSNRVISSKRH